MGFGESLEEQTMKQAQAVALLIEESLKYPNGESLECVIADNCIGGVAEAAAVAEQFSREGVGVSLTVTPVGVMARKLWIWTLSCPKQFGALMVRKDLERFT